MLSIFLLHKIRRFAFLLFFLFSKYVPHCFIHLSVVLDVFCYTFQYFNSQHFINKLIFSKVGISGFYSFALSLLLITQFYFEETKIPEKSFFSYLICSFTYASTYVIVDVEERFSLYLSIFYRQNLHHLIEN